MPEISRFFGIVIAMYYAEHDPPHFHARYNEWEAQVDIREGIIIRGMLPSKQARLVLAWTEIHREELLQMWETKEFRAVRPLE